MRLFFFLERNIFYSSDAKWTKFCCCCCLSCSPRIRALIGICRIQDNTFNGTLLKNSNISRSNLTVFLMIDEIHIFKHVSRNKSMKYDQSSSVENERRLLPTRLQQQTSTLSLVSYVSNSTVVNGWASEFRREKPPYRARMLINNVRCSVGSSLPSSSRWPQPIEWKQQPQINQTTHSTSE